ncbi:MAG: HupE/UreJ family protein [Rhodospirillaceae bacterium]
MSTRALTLGAVLVFFMAVFALPSSAHEVRPAVADVDIQADKAVIDIRVTLEPLALGINLNNLKNTNDAPEAADYGALRAKSAEVLETAFRAMWPKLQSGIRVTVAGKAQAPDLTWVQIGDAPSLNLPRDSRIRFIAPLPPGYDPVTFGWAAQFGPIIVRQVNAGKDAYTGYLRNGEDSQPLPRTGKVTEGIGEVIKRYIVIGFEHIIPKGLDHILFVLGLFFLSLKIKPLLIQVTAFTVAHTVTLALASLGIVTVPESIVEPLIAASIVYVAVENLLTQSINIRRTVLVFCFGLLHGLGFAWALGDIGLEPGRFVAGLISFNVGVELGQLAVIATAFVLLALPFGKRDWYAVRITRPASVLIAAVGAYWCVERVFF